MIDFERLYFFGLWFVITYGLMIVAMGVDLVTGVRKARLAGRARTSQGYKMTCDKAIKYFLPMLCLTCLDLIGSMVLPCPVFTMLLGAFNVFCEFKSVMEKTHEKEEIHDAANTMNVVLKNKDDIVGMIAELIKQNTKDDGSK